MKKIKMVFFFYFLFSFFTTFGQKPYADLSMRLIDAARYGTDYQPLLDSLATVEEDVLAKELDTDEAKKAFWINVYNAHIQFFLKKNPEKYENRNDFFFEKAVVVAGKKLSFDDIEHGIIRRSKNKYSLGFLPSLKVDAYEKKFRTKKVDGRVHLALNCGAKSCPAVAAYDFRNLDEQLDASAKTHLKATTTYDEATNTVYITKLFSWFRADFGNKKAVIKLLKKHEVLPQNAQPSIKYNDYDWTLWLDNFI